MYTRVHRGGEAVVGSTTHGTRDDAHHNTEAEPLIAHIAARTGDTVENVRRTTTRATVFDATPLSEDYTTNAVSLQIGVPVGSTWLHDT